MDNLEECVIDMANTKLDKKGRMRTSASVKPEDLTVFKELANIKFDEDPMNNAWQEAVKMWIGANINLYDQEAEEKKKKAEELKKKYK